MKLELLTNATVVDDAIRLVAEYEHHDNNQRHRKELQHNDSTTKEA